MAMEGIAVSGPGPYVPDPTAGLLNPNDLPHAKIVRRSRNCKHLPCPQCGKSCFRNRTCTRVRHDVGDLVTGKPRAIALVYSQHRGTKCQTFFEADTSEYSRPTARYTHRVVSWAVRLVVEDGLPYQAASWHLWRDQRVIVPFATSQNWVEAGGEKGGAANVAELSRLGPGGLLGGPRGR
jgi:hypothetical protein